MDAPSSTHETTSAKYSCPIPILTILTTEYPIHMVTRPSASFGLTTSSSRSGRRRRTSATAVYATMPTATAMPGGPNRLYSNAVATSPWARWTQERVIPQAGQGSPVRIRNRHVVGPESTEYTGHRRAITSAVALSAASPSTTMREASCPPPPSVVHPASVRERRTAHRTARLLASILVRIAKRIASSIIQMPKLSQVMNASPPC